MTKSFVLAASMAMLMTISGQALAATAAPNAQYQPVAANASLWQTADQAFNATDTAQLEAHQYHGGPKSND